MLLTVTFYPLKMAKMVFLDTFRPNRLTKHNLGAERTFLVAKIFYIPLPQYVSKSLGTLTQKVGNFPNPPPNGPLYVFDPTLTNSSVLSVVVAGGESLLVLYFLYVWQLALNGTVNEGLEITYIHFHLHFLHIS